MTATEKKVQGIKQEHQKLKEAIQSSEKQSFYFRKALKSKKEKTSQLQKTYLKICSDFNNRSIEQLKSELSFKQLEMELLSSGPKAKGFIGAVRRKSVSDAIDYIKVLIRMKENNFELFPIEIL
jgi:predicted RNase H-like nuclease (RuvC/YqgF family)